MEGQLRSYNKVIEGAGRLLITAFAQRILNCEEDEENPNRVQLTGALCKPPSYRTTPFGREIADLMLAVNRSYGKSDYIPCITWGRTARYAANLKIGDRVQLVGRFQSRAYQKQLPDGTALNKVAYEVSVSRLSTVRDEPRARLSHPAAADAKPRRPDRRKGLPERKVLTYRPASCRQAGGRFFDASSSLPFFFGRTVTKDRPPCFLCAFVQTRPSVPGCKSAAFFLYFIGSEWFPFLAGKAAFPMPLSPPAQKANWQLDG